MSFLTIWRLCAEANVLAPYSHHYYTVTFASLVSATSLLSASYPAPIAIVYYHNKHAITTTLHVVAHFCFI